MAATVRPATMAATVRPATMAATVRLAMRMSSHLLLVDPTSPLLKARNEEPHRGLAPPARLNGQTFGWVAHDDFHPSDPRFRIAATPAPSLCFWAPIE
jgi:hypothetical protein